MANGKPGDSPITDIILHNLRPYPDDVVEMVQRLERLNPAKVSELNVEIWKWKPVEREGKLRQRLQELLSKYEE